MPLQNKAYDEMTLEGINKEDVIIEKYLDMRYQGQSYEILVPYKKGFTDEFHKLHEQNYGYCNKDKPIEVVNIRLRARGMPEKPVFEKIKKGSEKPEVKAYLGSQNVVFDGATYRTGLYDRKELKSGNVIEGAAIFLEYSSTIVLPPHSKAEVDDYGNLVIDTEGGS
jgi:N-methylhydantoinase A